MQKIDLHTHQFKTGSSIQILNIFAQALPTPENENFYSAGLHPWHLESVNPDDCMDALEKSAGNKNLLAIGECGLDRSIATDMAHQERYFRKQTGIAEKYSKPLIIHCVRAFPELIKIKKKTNSTLPWIIHGYNANQQITNELVKHHFYFSVGESLLMNAQKQEIIRFLPLDHLFLETDDHKTSIGSIYEMAAHILKIDEEALADQLFKNFNQVFGQSL